MVNLFNKKIGIWGFGIVGQSAVRFFNQFTDQITIMEKKDPAQFQFNISKHINIIPQDNVEQFFSNHDYVLVSPGIDLRNFRQYQSRLLTEVDLFQHYFKKPIIAITGTIGKTTVTHLLSKILESHGKRIACGGNIGTGMLDLIACQDNIDYAVIEISSFQLEYSRFFAPDVGIITNIYHNHLDRHGSLEEYIKIKLSMIERQSEKQHALLPIMLRDSVLHHSLNQWYLSTQKSIEPKIHDIWIEHNQIIQQLAHEQIALASLDQFPDITFQENWLIIAAALHILNIKITNSNLISFDPAIKQHRLELIGTNKSNIAFYNDSKSTIAQATIAAAHQLQHKSIILILGGISKVHDKQTEWKQLIEQLPTSVKSIVAFGNEAHIIKQVSRLPCTIHSTLDDAFLDAYQQAHHDDQILFSPGGSSYDLYENYIKRGLHFTQLAQSALAS